MNDTKYILKQKLTVKNLFIVNNLYPFYKTRVFLMIILFYFIIISIIIFTEIDINIFSTLGLIVAVLTLLLLSIILTIFIVEVNFIIGLIARFKNLNTEDETILTGSEVISRNAYGEMKYNYNSVNRFQSIGKFFFLIPKSTYTNFLYFTVEDRRLRKEVRSFLQDKTSNT